MASRTSSTRRSSCSPAYVFWMSHSAGLARGAVATADRPDAELVAVALLRVVFAWPAEEREQPQPRSDSR